MCVFFSQIQIEASIPFFFLNFGDEYFIKMYSWNLVSLFFKQIDIVGWGGGGGGGGGDISGWVFSGKEYRMQIAFME